MVELAAGLAGFGGLLAEMVFLRRHALLLGNTAQAASVVLAVFLCGLGVGGLLVPRWTRLQRAPLWWAAVLYASLGLLLPLSDLLLWQLGSLPWLVGIGVAIVAPGLPAVVMGVAFPLLFGARRAGPSVRAAGTLLGANLLGSVAAAAWAGNVALPRYGFAAAMAIAAAAYVLAALLLVLQRRRTPAALLTDLPPTPAPRLDSAAMLAFICGALVLGDEVLLLRRLPFFLEGFQPTLCGVLASCLLGLGLGAALGTPLLVRMARRTPAAAAPAALLLGALALNLGLHEHAAPALSRIEVHGALGMHVRIWLAAAISAGPPCFFLGAVVPLCLQPFVHVESRMGVAGRLFFWQGAGGLAGALLVGMVLPRLWPQGFFVLVPPSLGALAVVPLLRRHPWSAAMAGAAILALGLAGVAGAGSLLAPRPPLEGSRHFRPGFVCLAHGTDSTTTASVVYDRRANSMMLFTDEFRAAQTGPGATYMRALGHVPFVLRRGLERVAVVALGTGTTASAVCAWPDPRVVHVVELSPAVLALAPRFAGDGPVATERLPEFLRDARTELHVTDGRHFLARRAPGSLDLITMEPLLPYAPGTVPLYTREFYAIARRVLSPQGLMVQWVPTHAMPAAYYATLLATFARSFPFHSVWLVDQSTLLVGSCMPHLQDLAELRDRLAALPEELRRALHEAGFASEMDFAAALVGSHAQECFAGAPDLHDDRPFVEAIDYWSGTERLLFHAENLRLLEQLAASSPDLVLGGAALAPMRRERLLGLEALARAALDPEQAGVAAAHLAAARAVLPQSVLLHREETLALRRAVEAEILSNDGREGARLAAAHLRREAQDAFLQACLGLPDAAGHALLLPAEATARATALDPLLFGDAPPFLCGLAPERAVRSPREDWSSWSAGRELAAAAAARDVRGLALRAALPVRAGHALVDVLGQRRLEPNERQALAQVLDPRLLEEAAAAVLERHGSLADEVLPLWRHDLPMPAAAGELRGGSVGERVALAQALAGRRSLAARVALAQLMLDDAQAVRTAAGVALFETIGSRIPYDPTWDVERRARAAAQWREAFPR